MDILRELNRMTWSDEDKNLADLGIENPRGEATDLGYRIMRRLAWQNGGRDKVIAALKKITPKEEA